MKTGTDKILTLLGFKVQGDLGPITCYTSRQNKVVWYLKAPPTKPASWLQTRQRNLFRYAGFAWQGLTPFGRFLWKCAALDAHLRITGYDLFTYLCTTGDEEAIKTVERQTGIELPRMI